MALVLLIFAPLSEILPVLGRNIPYVVTLGIGGASMQDIYSLLKLPYALTFWVSAAYCGPALGPLLSGFAVPAEDWRWSLWEILWMSGPVFVLFVICLPETLAPNILLKRAQRLRRLTGNHNLKSQSEIDQANMKASTVAMKPLLNRGRSASRIPR
ncbi:hypothetical protein V1506DRAFT_573982 [Lipomyces tetrasporus]